ncbi:homeobox protein BEL1 homolog [Phoenix dactylifera]|uniref:Homeobox protein BEL1 homolog n=1 Tax=Phoenix dactylifera TaxID=42345 RepID=A0A8B8J284_PHODC|nr:homeobox protein BEL1 homolog [Phoenix dactylifera]XP_008783446.1 homeobox protein BEL1 homolog [Phoenix dactylifera]XP_008783447.1 homeobox protein BEL1 homolog [Phoenix dactylifera]XP_026658656.1 homeobox protein BEL1 homolog [Phoenix dactylifera]
MAHHPQEKPGTQISPAFGYIDFSSTGNSNIQSFESNQELYSLRAGMEMLGRGFIPKVGGSSSGIGGGFCQSSNENLMVSAETAGTTTTVNSWQHPNRMLVEDPSLRCLFPNVANQQPIRGLSLSLCNPEPSESIAGMEQPILQQHLPTNSTDELFPKSAALLQDRRFFQQSYQQPRQLKSSKFLIPAQELLNEFCSLGGAGNSSKQKSYKANQWEEGGSSSNSSRNQSLYSSDVLELQKRKAKLLSMLEEVDRRYKKYCEQMRAVVSSFEAVAGEGAASVYSMLASKAMSKHFRCLKDGIVGQIRAIKKAMGEKDPVAPGTIRGETPRLKLIDQCLRQQKAFQQAGTMESCPWRPQRGLPECSVSILRAWLFEHFLHPYPSDVDKHILARQTGLSRSQVSNWFINARVRLWKPMVEEMYSEEIKEQDKQTSQEENNGHNNCRPGELQSKRNPNPNSSSLQLHAEDQKPTPGELLNCSDSLSSIVNSSHHCTNGRDPTDGKSSFHDPRQHHPVPRAENFGVMDLDFTSYGECSNQNFGDGVSLTLGLQQHNEGAMSLSFSPASQHSLFFSRAQMEDCQPGQFSILDGEAQNLPYRNLMGAQLLHDLAG